MNKNSNLKSIEPFLQLIQLVIEMYDLTAKINVIYAKIDLNLK